MKDSAITTSIKTQLAAQRITSLGRISVDTDKDGIVFADLRLRAATNRNCLRQPSLFNVGPPHVRRLRHRR